MWKVCVSCDTKISKSLKKLLLLYKLRGDNWMLLAHRPYYAVRVIRVKELSEPIVLWRKGDGF